MLIDKSEIRTLLPHSGSMCLLDQVLEWDEWSILCRSETHRDLTNPLRRSGRLSGLHAFEYGAQAAAIHGGLRARMAGQLAPPCYLAGLRDAHLHAPRLDDLAAPLEIRARRLFGDAGNTIYECEATSGQNLLARARITIIAQPKHSE